MSKFRFHLSYPHEVRRRREEIGMSLQDLCNISRVEYTKLQDIERGKVQHIDSPTMEALLDALDADGESFSYDYAPADYPSVTRVFVRVEVLENYIAEHGLNANEFAARAGVPASTIYGFTRRGKRACRATQAAKIAKAMNIPVEEFAAVLGLYPAGA